jgi:subtilisin-like proprotein convertase family protein
VNDTGVDINHPDLTGRVFLDAPGSGYDTDGHGTFVAGQIAGSGFESLTVTNAQGSITPGTNGQFRGKAPAASLYSVGGIGGYSRGGLYESGNDTNFFVIGQPFFLPGAANYLLGPAGQTNYFYPGFFPDWYFQEAPAVTNALISNNSWVNGGANQYDLSAASYDAAVRDALPERIGPQPVLFVFAAGNSGSAGANDGGGGTPDSIESPATAKNVITVGALEQQRGITNTYLPFGSTNPVEAWYGETDDSSQVAGFSARGNVGIGTEGTYGRFKPDVVAPGTFVISTRSTTWDEVTYYNPTNFYHNSITGETVNTNSLNYYSLSDFGFTAKSNIVSLTIQIFNPVPNVTNMPIYVSTTTFPNASNCDFSTAKNSVNIPLDSPPNYLAQIVNNGGDFNFSVGNPTNVPVKYNLFLEVVTTNDLGNYYQVLSNLNNSIGTKPYYYRYESGTSMAAADVSGVLALMQDYFTNTLHTTPSPALLKAMLINGARLTGFYNLQVNNTINYEGWGLVNLPNSVPPTLTNTAAGTNNSVFFVDQSPANALTTGDTRTYQISIPPTSQSQPLRVTLAWTDPPGNPAAAIKLVNNLSLTVSNLDNTASPVVYYGNDIETNQVYNTAQNPTNSTAVLDNINNVQNVFLPPHAGTNFAIIVAGAAVNVNAVTTQTNNAAGIYGPNISQDFVLVVSCGDGSSTNGFSVTSTSATSNPNSDQRITVIVSTNSPLMNQIVGASSPVMSTNTLAFPSGSPYVTNALLTIGQTNQWHFYVVTNSPSNTPDYTNAAFITFLPQTLAIPREGVFAGSDANSTLPEANIDLFVASGPGAAALTNLDATVIANCISNSAAGGSGTFYSSALSRGGTKFIVSTNSAPGQVYYIGVQSEDQMASEYSFLSEFSNIPFSQMTTNGEVVQFFQVEIPDGPASLPGYTNTIGVAIYPMDLRRVIVTNILSVQNAGDITVSLNHSTTANANSSVNLMSHNAPNKPGTNTFVYDDSGQGDVSNSIPSSGPGSLNTYKRQQGQGVWILHANDNAPGFLGNIQGSLLLQPHEDLKHGIYVTVQPHSWSYEYIDVPVGYTNLTVGATNVTAPPSIAPPVTLYLNYNDVPTFSNYLAKVDLVNGTPPGGSISYGPPLTPGPYYIGLYNASALPQTIYVIATLAFSASAAETVDYASTGPVPILDDAVTYAYIDVPRNDRIQGFNVGLRVDHPRISDLVFHLISPDGTRYLLMENRGADSTNGCGATYVTTNIVPVSHSGGPQATTNFVDVGKNTGPVTISWNFYRVPDTMDVYYQGVNIFSSGLISFVGSTNLNFGPGSSTQLEIVMNATNRPARTLWTYTVGGVVTNYEYLSFTEDTNLTTTPIKFAPTPFVPQTVFSAILTDSFEDYQIQSYSQGTNFGGWNVATNQVDVATNLNAHTGVMYLQMDNGVVYTNVPTVPGQKYTLTYWLASSVAEDVNGLPIPATNADWQAQTYIFTAATNNTAVVLAASANALTGLTFTNAQILTFDTNALIDDVMLIQLPGNLYYQAEQSLAPLIDTSAGGKMNNGDPWQLEILDTRAGATNNATLLSWQLEFTFANTNYLVAYPKLNGFQKQTNTIATNSIQWYQVIVPATANFATNILDSASGFVNLLYSANYPPTAGSSPGDMVLLTGSYGGIGIPVFSTNNTPLLVPGSTYYLGVQNSGSVPVISVVEVDFDHGNLSPGPLSVQFNSVKASSAGVQLSWSVTSGAQYQVQWKTNLTAAWNTITNPVTTTVNGVSTFTDDGAQSAPLGPMRFYRLVRIP